MCVMRRNRDNGRVRTIGHSALPCPYGSDLWALAENLAGRTFPPKLYSTDFLMFSVLMSVESGGRRLRIVEAQ